MLTVADCIEALTQERPEWAARQVIPDAAVDSRQVIPGGLFVALPGKRFDGHAFVGQAFERGATLALVERDLSGQYATIDLRAGGPSTTLRLPAMEGPFCLLVQDSLAALTAMARFWRRKLDLKVIGITGSVGKSMTKELAAEVLSQRYCTLRNRDDLNSEIGLPLSVLALGEGHQRAVLEMGFYVPGEIAQLCDLALPQIGVITHVGRQQAEGGSQETLAQGEGELVERLPAAPEGVAILNYDDPWALELAGRTRARVFTYGLNPGADLWADSVEGLGLEGIRFRLHFQRELLHLRVPLIGRHSVHAALRAAAVGLVDDLTWQEIVDGLRSQFAQLRLAAVRTASGALVLDDTYNASPESMMAALNLLDELDGRKVAVLGDMLELDPQEQGPQFLGLFEQRGHEMVGARAAEVVAELITVGERGRMIAAAARRAGLAERAITELDDPLEAIAFLEGRLGAGDAVLIKGSQAMRMERITAALETRS